MTAAIHILRPAAWAEPAVPADQTLDDALRSHLRGIEAAAPWSSSTLIALLAGATSAEREHIVSALAPSAPGDCRPLAFGAHS